MRFSLFNRILIIAAVLAGVLYSLPNLVSEKMFINWPHYLPDQKVNLGLDLQGGSHLVLEVQLSDVTKRAYENTADEIRGVLRESRLNYRNLDASEKGISLYIYRPEQIEDARKKIRTEIQGLEIAEEKGHFNINFTETRAKELAQHAMLQTLEILRTRVDEFGVAEPLIQRQGENRIIVELPGVDDVERAKSIIGRTAQLTFHLVDEETSPTGHIPRTRKVLYEDIKDAEGNITSRIPYVVYARPHLTGELLSGASTGFDSNSSEPAVMIKFDGRGTRKFASLSAENVGKRFAIVLDDEVYSAPVIREPILGGSAQITGRFTPQTAEDLATVLRAGALPAKVQVVEERTVGPSLGQDSVEAGQNAIAIGFVLVVIAMLIFYKGYGVVAIVALFSNLALMLGTMSALGFTLTLPGMAGILLTVGMAVDANVLIFERIKEEISAGRKLNVAYANGFRSAFGTILDANITTVIAAAILFAMGSGPIKGFALTLTIGILSSMFTATLLSRMILVEWLYLARKK